MKKSKTKRIIKTLCSIIIGIVSGGFIGLVIGGTFLGSFDIHETIGIEGYELTTYLGAALGLITIVYITIKKSKLKRNPNEPK